MSCSKGSMKRVRPQKHQNRTSFKNDLYDKSVKQNFINSIQPSGICSRCKDIIDWKIKYKKYKPLSAPKSCVRCNLKCVKHAYHVMCLPCARKEGNCAKCCKNEEIIEVKLPSTPAEDEEMQQAIKALPERKRRTLLRYLRKQCEETKKSKKKDKDTEDIVDPDEEEKKANLAEKINKLKLDARKENIEDYDSDFNDSDSDCNDSEDDDDSPDDD